jgi:radical SAM superfamily enzyme YgiQ (UPF0313 family)
MSSRILLVSINTCATPDPVFPLGLAQLAAALRVAGHEVRWHDVQVPGGSLEETLADFRPQFAGISLRNIDDVLIRKQETYFDGLNALCSRIRKAAGCRVILGGSGFSIFPRELFEFSGADFGICGAGDRSLVELISALEARRDVSGVPGLVRRHEGRIRIHPPAPAVAVPELDEADRPAAIVDHYLRTGGMLNVQTQRGCTFRCCYCTYPVIEGRTHLRQPPEQVAEEFAQAARLGAKYLFVVDSVFNSSARHVAEICEAIIHRNVKISWGCFLRPQGLGSELMQLMARAGLAHIEFGSDSFSDEVLASYQKDLTFEDIRHSSELARRHGIDYCHFLIAGGPGETPDTLQQGFERSRHLQNAIMMAVVGMRIYPGTHLFERALAEGRITRETNLLKPAYYLAEGLTQETVFSQLQEFSRLSPNWIAGDPAPAYARLVERLRQRGIAGPLWGYFSMIQRLWPQGVPASSAPAHA